MKKTIILSLVLIAIGAVQTIACGSIRAVDVHAFAEIQNTNIVIRSGYFEFLLLLELSSLLGGIIIMKYSLDEWYYGRGVSFKRN